MTTLAPIRTYHPRQGRLSQRHRGALADLGPALAVPASALDPAGPADLDLGAAFDRPAPVVLEIGSGMGEATVAMAAADPARNYVAVEVHRPGLANLLSLVAAGGLTNVRAVEGDAMVLLHRIAPASLDAVHLFCPDPWPKARHHKRRLVQPERVALLRAALRPGGTVHAATDDRGYAAHMLATLAADPGLSNVYDRFAPRLATRPVTKFERRGIDADRTVYDLMFRRAG